MSAAADDPGAELAGQCADARGEHDELDDEESGGGKQRHGPAVLAESSHSRPENPLLVGLIG